MFERHFGLRENPFPAGHQMRFLYPSREHQEARAHLRYGIENREPFLLITGEVGTGKTTALYDALAEWGNTVAVALITNSALTRQELIEEIALRFGLPLPPGSSKPQALVALERHLLGVRSRGEYAVLVLDEAQNLATDLLEEIRLLSNVESQGEKLLQIFLVGQPELEQKLSRPELRQLRQRITVHYRLNPLSPEETAGYVHHRVSVAGGNAWRLFPPDTCREIYRLTHGIPREINTVASAALIAAFAEGAQAVTAAHVQQVARETEFRSVLPGQAQTPDSLEAPPAPATTALGAATPPSPAPPAYAPPAPLPPPPPAAWQPPVEPGTPPPAWPPPPIESAPPTAPFAPPIPRPEPMAPAAPAWQPPTLEPVRPVPTVDPVAAEERDVWSAAVRDLHASRARGEGPAAAAPPRAPEPRFPSVAELEARSAAADPRQADLSHLPPRLRERIEAEIAREEQQRGMAPWWIGASVVAALAITLMLAQRFGAIDVPLLRGLAGTPRAEVEPLPADSLVGGAPTDTVMAPVVPAARETTRVAPAVRAAATTTPTVAPVPARTTPRADTTRVYGVAIGAFLDETRAGEERARIADATKMPVRIVPFRDSGVTMYRLVLGNWPSESAAEAAAGDLMSRGMVTEARVMPLARGSR